MEQIQMEPKHTKGPWRAVGGDELVFVERPNIAHVGVTGGNAYKAPFVVVGNPGHRGSDEADARLIAAAPDLLEALKQVLGWIDSWDPNFTQDEEWPETRHHVNAAIAKAEGV
jgi:hypothetical protein